MRRLFGPMCDAPSPREYIDKETDEESIQAFLRAMKEGLDIKCGVICRTLKSGRPVSILSVKHLRSYRNPDTLKYR